MSNRKSIVGQADIARVIRACRQAGQPVSRIVIRPDRVEVETGKDLSGLETVLAEESDGGIIL